MTIPEPPAAEPRSQQAFRSFVIAAVAIGVLGLAALVAQTPFLFPSLGATAFILIMAPDSAPSTARNALAGHVVGALAGLASFHVFALDRAPVSLANGGGVEHVAACALAVAVTCGVMTLAKLAHPPAGATALICGLGFLAQWWHVPMIAASVLVLTLTIRGLQRAGGERHRWWDLARDEDEPDDDAELEPGDPA